MLRQAAVIVGRAFLEVYEIAFESGVGFVRRWVVKLRWNVQELLLMLVRGRRSILASGPLLMSLIVGLDLSSQIQLLLMHSSCLHLPAIRRSYVLLLVCVPGSVAKIVLLAPQVTRLLMRCC